MSDYLLTYESFLRDIGRHPTPERERELIFADWLEDNGGAVERDWAAFIRGKSYHNLPAVTLQVVLAHVPDLNAIIHALAREEGVLTDVFADDTILTAHQEYHPAVSVWVHKGFMRCVRMGIDDWLRCGPLFVARNPVTAANVSGLFPKQLGALDDRHGRNAGRKLWAWYSANLANIGRANMRQALLPGEFYLRLGGHAHESKHGPCKVFWTEQSARQALSDAILSVCRGVAISQPLKPLTLQPGGVR